MTILTAQWLLWQRRCWGISCPAQPAGTPARYRRGNSHSESDGIRNITGSIHLFQHPHTVLTTQISLSCYCHPSQALPVSIDCYLHAVSFNNAWSSYADSNKTSFTNPPNSHIGSYVNSNGHTDRSIHCHSNSTGDQYSEAYSYTETNEYSPAASHRSTANQYLGTGSNPQSDQDSQANEHSQAATHKPATDGAASKATSNRATSNTAAVRQPIKNVT